MGHYNIRHSPSGQDMTTIVTEFGKFKYNSLPMGMCDSGDISQAKVNELLGDTKGIDIYINNILVLSKNSFYKQICQLRIIVGRLRAASLKVITIK